MSRKLSYLCLVLVLGLASTGYADYLIGNWEQASDGWRDWGSDLPIDDTTLMPSKYAYDDTWSSNGDWCLKLTKDYWNQNLAIRSYQSPDETRFRSEFLMNDYIAIDLHFEASEWANGDWAEISELSIQGTGVSWKIYARGAANQIDVGNPTNPGHWDQTMGTYTTTIYWNYEAERDTMMAAGFTPTNGYVNFIFTTNTSTANGSPGIFRFDNVRLTIIPEPATMVLLGLGGLALLRRKR